MDPDLTASMAAAFALAVREAPGDAARLIFSGYEAQRREAMGEEAQSAPAVMVLALAMRFIDALPAEMAGRVVAEFTEGVDAALAAELVRELRASAVQP